MWPRLKQQSVAAIGEPELSKRGVRRFPKCASWAGRSWLKDAEAVLVICGGSFLILRSDSESGPELPRGDRIREGCSF